MNYNVLNVVNESKKQIEEFKKEIKEEKLELKKADEAGEWDLKGPSLESSIEYDEKVLNDLENCLKKFKGFKQLTINYVDDIGSELVYDFILDEKYNRFYIYCTSTGDGIWITLNETEKMLNQLIDDGKIKKSEFGEYADHYKKLLKNSKSERLSNIIRINSSYFNSENLYELSNAVKELNPERAENLAFILEDINYGSDYR